MRKTVVYRTSDAGLASGPGMGKGYEMGTKSTKFLPKLGKTIRILEKGVDTRVLPAVPIVLVSHCRSLWTRSQSSTP